MIARADATGTTVALEGPPRRVVSLVPSVTELLHQLGVAERVVGVTTFCTAPPGGFPGAERVRGTKNPDVAAIIALEPDLVFANVEENRERHVAALRAAGLTVHVSYPRTVRAAVDTVLDVAALVDAPPGTVAGLTDEVERARRLAETSRPEPPLRVLCAIWRDPWMVVGPATYAGDLLDVCGMPVLPPSTETYPRVELEDVLPGADAVLLPSEPYAFTRVDADDLRARGATVRLVDGAALTWHGSRTASGLRTFSALARELAGTGQ